MPAPGPCARPATRPAWRTSPSENRDTAFRPLGWRRQQDWGKQGHGRDLAVAGGTCKCTVVVDDGRPRPETDGAARWKWQDTDRVGSLTGIAGSKSGGSPGSPSVVSCALLPMLARRAVGTRRLAHQQKAPRRSSRRSGPLRRRLPWLTPARPGMPWHALAPGGGAWTNKHSAGPPWNRCPQYRRPVATTHFSRGRPDSLLREPQPGHALAFQLRVALTLALASSSAQPSANDTRWGLCQICR